MSGSHTLCTTSIDTTAVVSTYSTIIDKYGRTCWYAYYLSLFDCSTKFSTMTKTKINIPNLVYVLVSIRILQLYMHECTSKFRCNTRTCAVVNGLDGSRSTTYVLLY